MLASLRNSIAASVQGAAFSKVVLQRMCSAFAACTMGAPGGTTAYVSEAVATIGQGGCMTLSSIRTGLAIILALAEEIEASDAPRATMVVVNDQLRSCTPQILSLVEFVLLSPESPAHISSAGRELVVAAGSGSRVNEDAGSVAILLSALKVVEGWASVSGTGCSLEKLYTIAPRLLDALLQSLICSFVPPGPAGFSAAAPISRTASKALVKLLEVRLLE